MKPTNERPKSRSDFSRATRRILAQRAAYRCSNPECNVVTIGPGSGAAEVAETGTASHIFAASPHGPRGDGDLAFDKRRELANGIWLCARCGRLVDANRGVAYPDSLLRSWRDLHETRIRIEQGGYAKPIGWVNSVDVHNHPLFQSEQTVHLSRCNLLVGRNGAGKSSLLSLLIGISRPQDLVRWTGNGEQVSVTVRWYDPHPRQASMTASDGVLTYEVDGRCLPLVARAYRTIILEEVWIRKIKTVSDLARLTDTDPSTVASVLPRVPERVGGRIAEVRVEGDTFHIRADGQNRLTPWGTHISGGVQIALVYEFAIAIADLQAEVEPTLLIMDGFANAADPKIAKYLLELMSASSRSFQTVLTTPRMWDDIGPEWLITTLAREEQTVRVIQSP